MKTYRYFLTAAVLMATMSVGAQGVKIYLKGYSNPIDYPASTIDKIEFYPAESDDPNNPNDPNQGNNSTDDKQFLEDTGLQLLNQFKASDFHNITRSVSHIDDYDTDELEDWVDDCLNSVKTALGAPYIVNGEYSVYQYTDYKYLLLASTFHGHFSVQNNKWIKESGSANDLQFTFIDADGKTCVARATTSGNTKTVHIINDKDRTGWDGDMRLYDNNMYYVDVPEHVEATYTINGMEMVHVSVDIDVSSLAEEWDLTSQGASTTVNVRITKENGVGQYDIVVNRAGYQAGTGAYANFSLSNDGNVILTANASAVGTVDLNVTNASDDPDINTDNFGVAYAEVDILGRVQVRSTINSVGNFIKYLEEADDNRTDKDEHRRKVGRANNELNAEFFYNGGSDKKGNLSLESFEDYSWGDTHYYDVRPIITFTSDGSSYALETYFSEDAFQTVVDTYKNLIDDFNDMLKK